MSKTRKKSAMVVLLTSSITLIPKISLSETNSDSVPSNNQDNIKDSTNQKEQDIKTCTTNTKRSEIIQVETLEKPEFSNADNAIKDRNNSQPCKPDTTEKAEFTKQRSPQEPNNRVPSRSAVNKKINPFTTTLPLNGTLINHLSPSEVSIGSSFGDNQNTTFNFNSLFKLDSQIQENLSKDNIFTIEQTGKYLQLRTVQTKSEITVNIKEPKTIVGTDLQLSLTGSCMLSGGDPNSQCTYTPGLVTDTNSIDPNTLFPRRIFQTSKVGDVVTPESLIAIQESGFQGGANGQNIGLDLSFPNTGSRFGNHQSNKTEIDRQQNLENTPIGFYSTVRQIVRANDKEAVIGRTIRGFGGIAGDKNFELNSAFQITSNLMFPDIVPQISGSDNPVNKNINRNLFFAANNVRIPANSFTFYHGGSGRAETPIKGARSDQLPDASFDGLWIGVSPVTTRSLSRKTRYQLTSPRREIASAGGEGGLDSNVRALSLINGIPFSSYNLNQVYTQVYLKMYDYDANFITSSHFTEETNYYPHVSLTGNTTGFDHVWRYYGGVIVTDNPNAYIGTDYTKNGLDGWNYSIGGIVYTNPDKDYYSQLQGSVSKRIPLDRNNDLVLSSGFNYAIDRKIDIGGNVFDSPASSVTLGARANLGSFSFGLVNYFGEILPNSIANTLLADVTVKFSDRFLLSGYYTPINDNSNRSRFGVQTQFLLSDTSNSPRLTLSWTNNDYDYGTDSGGNKLNFSDNVFRVMYRSKF